MAKRRRVRMVPLPSQFPTRQLPDDCFGAAGVAALVVVQPNAMVPMIELIRHTGLAGIIAETAVSPSADLRVVPLEDRISIPSPGILGEKGATRSPAIKHFADIIRWAAEQAK